MRRMLQTGVLGHGTFGLVIRAIDREACPPVEVAIKLLPRGNFIKNFKTYVNREILHQSSLKHPCIIALREVRPETRVAGLVALLVFLAFVSLPNASDRHPKGESVCSRGC